MYVDTTIVNPGIEEGACTQPVIGHLSSKQHISLVGWGQAGLEEP